MLLLWLWWLMQRRNKRSSWCGRKGRCQRYWTDQQHGAYDDEPEMLLCNSRQHLSSSFYSSYGWWWRTCFHLLDSRLVELRIALYGQLKRLQWWLMPSVSFDWREADSATCDCPSTDENWLHQLDTSFVERERISWLTRYDTYTETGTKDFTLEFCTFLTTYVPPCKSKCYCFHYYDNYTFHIQYTWFWNSCSVMLVQAGQPNPRRCSNHTLTTLVL